MKLITQSAYGLIKMMSKRNLQILLALTSGLLVLSLLILGGMLAWNSSPQMIQVRIVVPVQWQPYVDWLLSFPGRQPDGVPPALPDPVWHSDTGEF